MAQDDDESVPLEQFITFLVKDTLPRTIEIVQGLYGDEMSSLSTGQTITITNVKLHHVIGKLKHHQGGMELTVQIPTDYAGSFYIVPETEGFETAGDLAENLMLGCFPGLQSTFINHKAIVLPGGQTVPKLSQLVPSAVLYKEGEQEMLEILLLQDSFISERILLPFDCCGGFVEVIDKNALPLTDVLDSRLLQKRQRCVCLAPSKDNTSIPGLPQNFNGHLILQAIYTVQGFHTDGKEMLEFLSSTDVEVADVTRVGKMRLSRPVVTLGEIHSRTDIRFPLRVEVCESDRFNLALHGGFVSFENGSHLVLHKSTMVKKFVLTKNHGIDSQPPEHFLIGEQYMGRFFRIARKLSTIHECRAFNVTDFVATKSFDSCDRTTICIDVGDLYKVKTYNITYNNGVETIKAIRKNDDTSVWLDCNASGDFVEVLMDKEPMSISDLTKTSNFPFEVKCEEWGHTAPLKWMKGTLTIECSIKDRCLVATLPTTIKDRGSFEIPVDRFYLTVRMLETVVCEAPTIISCSKETIEPLNQESYLRIKAFENTSKQVAPKRPPKGIKPQRDGTLVKQRENPKENKQDACANDVLGKIQQDKESLASPKPFPRGRSLLPPPRTSSQVSQAQPDDEDDYEIVEDFYNSLPRSH